MKLKKNSWHYRSYYWLKGYPPEKANLCPYSRAVFIWAPLRYLFAKGKIGKVWIPPFVYAFLMIELPRWAGIFNYRLKITLYILFGIALTIAAGITSFYYLIVSTIFLMERRLRRKMEDTEWAFYEASGKERWALPERFRKKNKIVKELAKKICNKITGSLLWAYIRAKHEKICPIVTFED